MTISIRKTMALLLLMPPTILMLAGVVAPDTMSFAAPAAFAWFALLGAVWIAMEASLHIDTLAEAGSERASRVAKFISPGSSTGMITMLAYCAAATLAVAAVAPLFGGWIIH